MPEAVQDPKAAFLALLAEGHFSPHPDRTLVARLQAIAASWSEASQHFYAGYALWRAMDFAWGEVGALKDCALGASREFEAAVTNPNANELEVAAALRMWALEVGMNYRDVDPTLARGAFRVLEEELAERLIHIADKTDDLRARAGFLVRGFQLETDFGELSQDTYGEAAGRAGGWNSANIDLWAKYFRAQAAMAQIIRTPGRASALLDEARDAVQGTESGWQNPQVTCFRILIGGLCQIIDGSDPVAAAASAREALFARASRVGFDENDRLAVEFLDGAASAFAEIRDNPARGYTTGHLSDALKILGRIPLMGGDEVVSAIEPAVGERALATQVLGQYHTWMYRTIEGISDETALQKLLLRLMQAQLPLYAQRRHGPIEYGKDIVALVDVDGEHALQMYQVKAGDITKSNWAKARDELEEMFQVDMSSVQLPVEPDRREGVLVFNGHINPYVEPVVEGWIKEQKDDHHRLFTIIHLESIVRWIAENNLVNELRQALAELSIGIDAV